MIATIASQQLLLLRRQRTFVGMLCIFLVMATAAGMLGWSSHHTIVRVYDDAKQLLAAAGKPAPPNPFTLTSPLSLLSNMTVYVPLLGALLALLLGHLSMIDDQTDGTGRLVFSRPVSRTVYVIGKMMSAAAALAAIMVASWLLSALSLAIVHRSIPSVREFGQLTLFYALSWMYLIAFALIGMVTVLLTQRRSLALLSAVGLWLVVTFAVPQFTSGLRPSASLNPITDPVSTSQRFFDITAKARPFSVVEQYKAASGRILEMTTAEPVWDTVRRVLPLAVLIIGLVLVTIRLIQQHDFSRSVSNE